MLSKCGNVNIWKRVQGANGKLQAFGYCDFADPESAMRAMRILHDFELADKKLVVKADAKTQEKLDDYVRLKPTGIRTDDKQNPVTKKEDEEIRNQIVALLSEHEIELNQDPDPNKSESISICYESFTQLPVYFRRQKERAKRC
jgi:RNA-binding protein 25